MIKPVTRPAKHTQSVAITTNAFPLVQTKRDVYNLVQVTFFVPLDTNADPPQKVDFVYLPMSSSAHARKTQTVRAERSAEIDSAKTHRGAETSTTAMRTSPVKKATPAYAAQMVGRVSSRVIPTTRRVAQQERPADNMVPISTYVASHLRKMPMRRATQKTSVKTGSCAFRAFQEVGEGRVYQRVKKTPTAQMEACVHLSAMDRGSASATSAPLKPRAKVDTPVRSGMKKPKAVYASVTTLLVERSVVTESARQTEARTVNHVHKIVSVQPPNPVQTVPV